MEIKGKVHCFFEQSGTFKNEFIKLGIPAEVCSDNFNGGEPFTTTIYFLNNGAWVAESTLFLSEEEAREQIVIREEWLQRRGM